jgi:hypothetical protein
VCRMADAPQHGMEGPRVGDFIKDYFEDKASASETN